MLEIDVSVLKEVFGIQQTPVPNALSSVDALWGHNLSMQHGMVPCKRLKAGVPSR